MSHAGTADGTGGSATELSEVAGPQAELAARYLEAALSGDRTRVVGLVTEAVEGGVAIESLYMDVFQPVLREVGRLWEHEQATVAQEHFATAATQLAMSTLYPRIFADRGPRRGRLLAVCVGDELHEIGLRMLADIFELRGWDTHFVGASVPMPDVVSAVHAQAPDVIAISVTLRPHVGTATSLISVLRDEGTTAPILVGGRPFLLDPELYRVVGADGTATDAVRAVALADELLP